MDEREPGEAQRAIAALPTAQQERLSYIDFRLYFLGELRRADLADRFGTALAAATRDIAQYRELAPGNLELHQASKAYRLLPTFVPLFEHQPERVLTALSRGFGDGLATQLPLVRSEVSRHLSLPDVGVIAPLTRAIHRRKAVRVGYTSIDSGKTEREVVPHALVEAGLRWQVRVFDRRRSKFLDFVLTRIDSPVVLEDGVVQPHEAPEHDHQWTRLITLKLVPHPDHPRPEVVRMDYRMPGEELEVTVRASNAGYILREWNVDCSPDHRLLARDHPLWLPDPLMLYGADSLLIAPGYVDPRGDGRVLKAL